MKNPNGATKEKLADFLINEETANALKNQKSKARNKIDEGNLIKIIYLRLDINRDKEEKKDICFFRMSTKERIKKFSKKTLDKCIPFLKLKNYTKSIEMGAEEAKDYLIYGIQAEKLEKGKKIDVVLYFSDYSQTELVILEKIQNKIETLDLKMILDVSFYFKEVKFKYYFINSNGKNANNTNNNNNNKENKKRYLSCFGSSSQKNKEIYKKNNLKKDKSKKISCLGNNSNKNIRIKNNEKFDNNNNNSINSNSSIENKHLDQLNINSSKTKNTVPDNNTNNNANNANLNSISKEIDTSEFASAAKRFISLIKSISENINLLFKSEEDLKIFTIALFQIYQIEKSEAEEKQNLNVFEKYLKKIWQKFDLNMSNFLAFPDFIRMIKLMDLSYNCIFSVNLKDEKAIRNLFEKLDKENIGKISFEDFYKFYTEIFAGSEFEEVFLNYSKGKPHMNFEDLSEFVITEQKQFLKSDEIAEIFFEYKIEVPETPRNPKAQVAKLGEKPKLYNDKSYMSYEKDLIESGAVKNKLNKNVEYKLNLMEFKNFISDKSRFSIFNLDAFEIAHDMTKPLNDYFVFSSHNTFLNKNIYGEGSLEMFNYAINEGCRMLELECYDGEAEPKICQGSSINEVLLKDALLNLRENSFKNSNFPLIISLENYCKKEQQIVLAQYLREILKDLFTINSNKLPEKYPSPKELEGKFIIKESKTLEISRKSSLPMGNMGNIIKKTDTEYNLNHEILYSSKDISNSFSQINVYVSKDVDEELMQFLTFYNLDLANKNEDLFDFEAFEDIPDENIHHTSLLQIYSIIDRKAEREDQSLKNQFKSEITLKKLNTYGHLVINELIIKSNQNISNSSINQGNKCISLLNTTKALSKSNSMTLNNKSSKSDINTNINIFHSDNKNNEETYEEDDRLLSLNFTNIPQRKKIGQSFLSEIKEKEDDYDSSYKKHCRSRDSDGITLNRLNSKFSDSNIYNNKNINSDSSNRLNSLLHFSIDKQKTIRGRKFNIYY